MRYSDKDLVEAVYKGNQVIEMALFDYCKNYFDSHYKAVFFVEDEYKKEIFQESIIKLVSLIERRKIYVEKGVLRGHDGRVFSGKLTTFFMGIAKMKYMEWVRKEKRQAFIDKRSELEEGMNDLEQYQAQLYGGNETMLEIIEDLYRANDIYVAGGDRYAARRLDYQHKAMTDIRLLAYMAQLAMEYVSPSSTTKTMRDSAFTGNT